MVMHVLKLFYLIYIYIMNRLFKSFIGYLTKNKPKFYGIPFNEQYECKIFI